MPLTPVRSGILLFCSLRKCHIRKCNLMGCQPSLWKKIRLEIERNNLSYSTYMDNIFGVIGLIAVGAIETMLLDCSSLHET